MRRAPVIMRTSRRCSSRFPRTPTPTISPAPAASRCSRGNPISHTRCSSARSSAIPRPIARRSASRRRFCCAAISTAPRARSTRRAAVRTTRTSRNSSRTPSAISPPYVSDDLPWLRADGSWHTVDGRWSIRHNPYAISHQPSAMMTKQSSRLFTRAQAILPGGVDSPVRAFKSVGASPLFIRRASGSRIVDVDGNAFVDYVMSWGPLIHGHAPKGLTRELAAAAKSGTSFGAPSPLEVALGEKVRAMMPSLERVRFVSSGTEAAMSAVRVARAATGRDRIVKFEGCYHGHADAFLVKAGSGALTLGTPRSPGVTKAASADTIVASYNDIASVRAALDQHRGAVAAVIVEPIAGNMGLVPPADGFLRELRDACTSAGALLIFDEVISGFRAAAGG